MNKGFGREHEVITTHTYNGKCMWVMCVYNTFRGCVCVFIILAVWWWGAGIDISFGCHGDAILRPHPFCKSFHNLEHGCFYYLYCNFHHHQYTIIIFGASPSIIFAEYIRCRHFFLSCEAPFHRELWDRGMTFAVKQSQLLLRASPRGRSFEHRTWVFSAWVHPPLSCSFRTFPDFLGLLPTLLHPPPPPSTAALPPSPPPPPIAVLFKFPKSLATPSWLHCRQPHTFTSLCTTYHVRSFSSTTVKWWVLRIGATVFPPFSRM